MGLRHWPWACTARAGSNVCREGLTTTASTAVSSSPACGSLQHRVLAQASRWDRRSCGPQAWYSQVAIRISVHVMYNPCHVCVFC
jgi:hypothetical protein